jgi:hypothetical protein
VKRVTATTIRQIELELEKARAWPSVARPDFLNLAFAALRSLSSAMALRLRSRCSARTGQRTSVPRPRRRPVQPFQARSGMAAPLVARGAARQPIFG